MRRAVAILALLGLVTAPGLSRTTHVCRFSGEVLEGCAAEGESDAPVLVDEGCCERRQLSALGQMRASLAFDAHAIAPVLLQPLRSPARAPARRVATFARPVDARAIGPPLFVEHHALVV